MLVAISVTPVLPHLQHALTLAEQTNDLPGQAHTYYALAEAWGWRREDRRALEHAHHALCLFQALDLPVWKADALNAVGWYAARLGEYDQARTHCQAALELCRRHHHREGEADTLDSLGYIAHHTEAVDYYQQPLTLFRNLGHTSDEADTLDYLAPLRRPRPARPGPGHLTTSGGAVPGPTPRRGRRAYSTAA